MTNFKATPILVYTRSGQRLTEDNIYWKDLDFPLTVKESGNIVSVTFSPERPYNFAVSSSTKVQLYDTATTKPTVTLSRFKRSAFGTSFRADGQLLAVGDEEGILRIFAIDSKLQLRLFKGHQNAVHCCKFLADKQKVASFSDDQTVRCWDVAAEQELTVLRGHTDYVRCGAAAHTNSNLIVSGSYDHSVKVWDLRSETEAFVLDHGCPVEAVLLFPNDSLLFSAVWDLLSGRLLTQVSNHHKTITSLSLCSANKRLLSGSLDRHVKVYDLGTYEVVHTLDFPAPVLNLGISPDDELLAVGMTGGLLSIQKRKPKPSYEDKIPRFQKKERSFLYRLPPSVLEQSNTTVIPHDLKTKLPSYDKFLKRFEHSKALDTVLKPYFLNKRPEVVISLLRELRRRGALKQAIAGRPYETLAPLVKFLTKHISTQAFMRYVLDVVDVILDIYGDNLLEQPPKFKNMFRALAQKIRREAHQSQLMLETLGCVEVVLSMVSTEVTSCPELLIGNVIISQNRRRDLSINTLPDTVPISLTTQ